MYLLNKLHAVLVSKIKLSVFTVTFDQFNASLLNKFFFILLTQLLNVSLSQCPQKYQAAKKYANIK